MISSLGTKKPSDSTSDSNRERSSEIIQSRQLPAQEIIQSQKFPARDRSTRVGTNLYECKSVNDINSELYIKKGFQIEIKSFPGVVTGNEIPNAITKEMLEVTMLEVTPDKFLTETPSLPFNKPLNQPAQKNVTLYFDQFHQNLPLPGSLLLVTRQLLWALIS